MKILLAILLISFCIWSAASAPKTLLEHVRLKQEVTALQKETEAIQTRSNTLRKSLSKLPRELEKQTLSPSHPLEWSYHWLQQSVQPTGLEYDTQYSGDITPFQLSLPKRLRDNGCYRSITFTAYELEIEAEASLPDLLRLTQRVENASSAAIVNSLHLSPCPNEQEEQLMRMQMRIILPAFLYDEELAAIQKEFETPTHRKPNS